MRGTWAIIAVTLSLLLFIGIFTAVKGKQTTQEYLRAADSIGQDIRAERWADAEATVKTMRKDWETRGDILQMWVNHADVDTVSMALRELSRALEMRESYFALNALEELLEGVEHLYHRDAFSLKNIL